jgi:CRISPR system Cascade subunit CasD
MEILLLRFNAPMMSFGAPIVDSRGVIQPYPALSMMTGMLANALGYDHSEFNRLEGLQHRLQYASRQDRRGEKMQDFQTVDFSQDHLDESRAWTTRGTVEGRSTRLQKQTHIRRRDYWVDAVHTVAVTLDGREGSPTIDDLADAVKRPERPLFIGRKTCLPATPLFLGRTQADNLYDALRKASLAERADFGPSYRAWWPCEPSDETDADIARPVTDRRDWRNQIHVGERWIAEGSITVEPEETDDA